VQPTTLEPNPRKTWTQKHRESWRRGKEYRAKLAAAKLEQATVILERLAEFFGYSVVAMQSPNMTVRLRDARHIACYLIRKSTGLPYHEIGPLFERTGSAISHACREVSRKLARWPGGSTAIAIAQAEAACMRGNTR
jgi:chromosomal replication initiation ATPase DnaA